MTDLKDAAGDGGADVKIEKGRRNRTPVKRFDPSEYYSPNYTSFLKNRKAAANQKFLQRKQEYRNSLKKLESAAPRKNVKTSSTTTTSAPTNNGGLLKLQKKPMNPKSNIPAPTKSILKKSNFFRTPPAKYETSSDSDSDSEDTQKTSRKSHKSANFTKTKLEKEVSENEARKRILINNPNLSVKVEKSEFPADKKTDNNVENDSTQNSTEESDAKEKNDASENITQKHVVIKAPKLKVKVKKTIFPEDNKTDNNNNAELCSAPTKPILKKSNFFCTPPSKHETDSDLESDSTQNLAQESDVNNPTNANGSTDEKDDPNITQKRVVIKAPNLTVKVKKTTFPEDKKSDIDSAELDERDNAKVKRLSAKLNKNIFALLKDL
uniref:Uncharacterized protein n=1 Tax=Panagrolaimus superbus TaxID=310955 RepID=A0A914YXE0_9BILA